MKRARINAASFSGDARVRIFCNEHLTKTKQVLFKSARDLQNYGYAFVWMRNGTILVREEEASPVVRILNEEKIKELKGNRVRVE